jgi:hypothetical protein
MIPIESKFISGPGGLCDLASGRTTLPEFEVRLLGRRYRTRRDVGLHEIADRTTLEAGLARLGERLPDEPWTAAAEYAHGILDPIATAAGAKAWVDMNPGNVFRGRELLLMFPNMRLVHSVRDGRDVAASVVPLPWGPNDLDTALDWWARRIERAFAACDDMPPERVLVVQMENLVAGNREHEYARLLAFTGLSDHPDMRAYFDAHITEERSHIGRWLEDVPPDRRADFEAAHERVAAALRNRRRAYAPLPPRRSLSAVG